MPKIVFDENNKPDVEPVTRVRFVLPNETNCYLLIGKDFCEVRFPDENKPELQHTRDIVNGVCAAVLKGLNHINKKCLSS